MASGRYARAVHGLDAGARVVEVACPKLVPLIEAGAAADGRLARRGPRVRRAAEARGVRHGDPRLYALPADPARLRARLRARRDARLLGRGDRARGGRDPRPQGRRERQSSERALPFPTTGSAEEFRPARRALPAASVGDRRARRARASSSGRPRSAPDARRPRRRRAAPARGRPRLRRAGTRLGADLVRADTRPLHRDGRGGRAALACRERARLADGRVRDAPGSTGHAHAARGQRAASRRGERSRSSA